MQKFLLTYFILCCAYFASAQQSASTTSSNLSIQPKIGYSFSNTSFNISGNELGNNPNILSELIWYPTNSLEFGVELDFIKNNFLLKSSILFNNTMSGNVTDFDYDGDNRTLPYTQLYLRNDKGFGLDFKIQPGYNWSSNDATKIVTYAGINYISKRLYLLNDKNWRTNNQNYISGLNSYYQYKFPNYGIGLQIDHNFNPKFSGQIGIEGYFSKYYAYGNWNLIEEFEKPISYEHKGNGQKFGTNMGLMYHIGQNGKIGIEYDFNYFNIKNGKDYLYHKVDGLLKTKLNVAKETKHSIFIQYQHSIF